LTPTRKIAAVVLAVLAGVAATRFTIRAQLQSQPSSAASSQAPAFSQMNLNLVVLDPAHGGQDNGAVLGSNVLEKDITLAVAARLRAALTAAGFTVLGTRDANPADPLAPLSTDQRAEIANHAHAMACIVLHATNSGSGVHVYTSTLSPSASGDEASSGFAPVPWEMAQAGSIDQSNQLAEDLRSALAGGNLPVAVGKAPVRPLDNLMCPAVAVEVAPLSAAGSDATPVTDGDYQQRVAGALAAALQSWRTQATAQMQQQGAQ
jgi:N-acetylmuramoyl-L-alanine amidase